MLYSYDIKKEDIYNYTYILFKKINKSHDKKIILTFCIALLIIFSAVSYFSITPDFLYISTSSNFIFLIFIIISIYLLYISINKFFKQLNYIGTKNQGIIINDFYQDGYIIQIDDICKTLEISTNHMCININLLEDINKVHVFKDFISTNFNGINIFFPKEKNILSVLKECGLI